MSRSVCRAKNCLPTFRLSVVILMLWTIRDICKSLSQNLSLWDSQLNEDEILLIKLHPFLHGLEDFSGYHHILPFPASWDTYEGLSVCDTLITDYSSVFYDYANSGKKIILLPMTARNMKVPVVCMKTIDSYPFDYTEKSRGGHSICTLLRWHTGQCFYAKICQL